MASTPVILLSKRSGNSSDRPNAATVQAGEAAMSFGAADPGLYFKDSAGSIRKFGSNHYGATAPNSSPLGSPGNSVGETWVDNTASYYLRVWTGGAWQKVGAGFSDTANNANFATTAGSASTATVANSAIVASGAFSSVIASGALSAVAASGSLSSVIASGALSAVIASGAISSTISSGSLSAVIASGALSAVIASGSLSSVVASGIAVVTALPTAVDGYLVYLNSGASGLYVSANGGWILT
jgi:hypothetical protein